MLSWVNELVRLPSAAASAAVGNTPPSHGSLLFASSLLLTHLYQRYAAYHTRKLNCSQKSVGSGVGKQRPPVAKKVKHEIVFGYHPSQYRGDNVMNPPKKRIDYYQWLRDDDRKDKEILKYIELENQYCEQRLRHLKPLSRHIYQEAKSYMKETDTECPYPRGSYHYFTRTFEGQAYKILCRYESKGKEILQPIESIEAMDGVKVETILNENEIAQGKDYCHVEYAEVSPSQNMLAFAVDFSG